MQIRCKCHGMSGSCQLKTCWKSAPDFRVVGKVLKQLFRKAVLVDQSNMGNGSPLIIAKSSNKHKSQSRNVGRLPRKIARKHKKVVDLQKMENSLFYYQRSPNFCDKDVSSDIQGNMIEYTLAIQFDNLVFFSVQVQLVENAIELAREVEVVHQCVADEVIIC